MHTPSCYTPPVCPLAMPPRTSHLHPQRTKVAVSSPAADGVQTPAHAVCESCRPAPLNNTSYCAAVETGLGQPAVALQPGPPELEALECAVRVFKNSLRWQGLAIPPAVYSASGQLAAPVNTLALTHFFSRQWLAVLAPAAVMCTAHAFRRVLSSRPLPAVHVPRSPLPMAVGDAHVRIAVGLATTLLWQAQLPACESLVQGSRNQAAVPGFLTLHAVYLNSADGTLQGTVELAAETTSVSFL